MTDPGVYLDADAPVAEPTLEDLQRMNEALIEQGWRDERRIFDLVAEVGRLKMQLRQMTDQRDHQMERARLANVRADAIDGMRRHWKGMALKAKRITEPTETEGASA